MRANEFISEESSVTYVLYVNEKPMTKYQDAHTLQKDLAIVKRKFPDSKFTVKKEVCKISELDAEFIR
jgi:hypothetical protein